jgi:hypothetical protein
LRAIMRDFNGKAAEKEISGKIFALYTLEK